jgi:hypothetical protein
MWAEEPLTDTWRLCDCPQPKARFPTRGQSGKTLPKPFCKGQLEDRKINLYRSVEATRIQINPDGIDGTLKLSKGREITMRAKWALLDSE